MSVPINVSEHSLLVDDESSDPKCYSAIELDSTEGQDEETAKEEESLGTFWRKITLRKRLIAIVASFVNFAALSCFAMMAPFLPLEATAKGIDGTAVGIIFASFEFVMVIGNILFGRFISAIGARFMFISGSLMAAVCTVLFGFLQWCPPGQAFLFMAIACRLVEGIGTAMCQTASMAIVASEFPERVATVMGLLETFAGLGFMVGPAIGGALYQLGGFFLPFVVIGGLFFLTGIVAWVVLPQSITAVAKDRSQLFRKFISIPMIWICGTATAVCSTLLSFMDAVFASHLASIDDTLASNALLMGLVFLVEPALYTILTPFAGYFSDKAKYPLIYMFIGNLGYFAAHLLIGPCPLFALPVDATWVPIFAFSLIGIFTSFVFMPAFAAMNTACIEEGLPNDLDLYGLIAGFFGTLYDFGAFCGPVVGGALVQYLGFPWATSIASLVPLVDAVVVAIACAVFYFPRRS